MAAVVPLPSSQGLTLVAKAELIAPYLESERLALIEYNAMKARRASIAHSFEYFECARRARVSQQRVSDLWWVVRGMLVDIAWARGLICGYRRAAKRVRARMMLVLYGPCPCLSSATERKRLRIR